MYGPTTIDTRFSGELDKRVWTPSYLPAWSSRAAAAASYLIDDTGLVLHIPQAHPVWCPDLHDPPLRVSAVQSGNWSGPVGSTAGQQPFRTGLQVREHQPANWGFTPHFGHIEVECRAELGPSSMFSAWLVGLEDVPERCGEICLVEVFGDTVHDGRAAVGMGIHAFRDEHLREEFAAVPMPIDVSVSHRYAVQWSRNRVDFFVDDVKLRTANQAPDYPMELIVGVFDFPGRRDPDAAPERPRLTVERIVGTALNAE